MVDINHADGVRTFDHDEEATIPEDMTFTAAEWDVIQAGRAARMVAAGKMPSLEELLTAMALIRASIREEQDDSEV